MSTSPVEARNLSLLSVVVPCLDEEQIIRETHRRLTSVLESSTGLNFEIIYVDDGSQDSTLDILRELQKADKRVRVISLTRNFGQFQAFTAGMQYAAGDAVTLIDADLQDPPEVIPEMLERWRQGIDIVQGLRTSRPGEKRSKVWFSNLFMRIFRVTGGTKLRPGIGDFMIIDRAVLNSFLAMPETERYLRGMISWLGYNHETFPFDRKARAAGKTKYSLKKSISLAINSMLSFTITPLRIVAWIGFLSSGLAFVGIIYALAIRLFTDAWVPGWAIIFITILALNGLQFIFLGIIGEYLGRTYNETKRRPLYLVRECLGFAPTDDAE